jgi:SAM-dependent methyltransferase
MGMVKRFKQYQSILHNTVYHEPESVDFHNKMIDELHNQVIVPMGLSFDTNILDVGCGSGYWLEKMKAAGYDQLTGITLDDTDVQHCRSRGVNVVKGDFTFTDFTDDSFGFIFCRHAIEHSPYPIMTLMELNRLLKPGGMMYIEVPAPDQDRKHEENLNHFSIMGAKMWLNLIKRTGFEVQWFQELDLDLQDKIDFVTVDQKEKWYCCVAIKNHDVLTSGLHDK